MFESIIALIILSLTVILLPILPKLMGGRDYRDQIHGRRPMRQVAGNVGNFFSALDVDIENGIDTEMEQAHHTSSLCGMGCKMYNENR